MTVSKPGKKGLGRGLSALMADVSSQASDASDSQMEDSDTRSVPVEKVRPNPDQPRKIFVQEQLESLANSIREKGILQPLLVRKIPNKSNSYEIIAGERRWRAAQIAQLHEVPVLVRDYSDKEVLEIAIIENVQRDDLNPVEEATGYRQLMDRFGHTQEQVARALSKSRSHVANLLRMLNLPDDVLDMVKRNQLSAGHARALVGAEEPSKLARTIISKGLSVRATEQLVKNSVQRKTTRKKARTKDADTAMLEKDLSANLKMKVVIDHNARNSTGKISVEYGDMEELDQICRRLSTVL